MQTKGRFDPTSPAIKAYEQELAHQFAELMNFKVLHVMKKPLDLQALQQALEKLKTFVSINGDASA